MSAPWVPVWYEMPGEVIARRLDGVITAVDPLDAQVDRITYDVAVFNTSHVIPAASLRNLVPFGRVTADMDVRAAKIGQPCKVYAKGNGPFWLEVKESLISDPCS